MSTRDIIDSATEDFWHLSESAENDLANIETSLHVACQKNGPKCQEPVSVSFWRNRAIGAVNTLRYLQAGSKQMYLETGAKYCATDFSQKAKYAHDARCAPAHDQFWLSKTPRHGDPFFAPMDQILRLCDQAEAILKTSKTHWEVKQAFVHINNARAHVGRVIGPLGDLLDGVELMAKAENRRAEGKYTNDGLPSRESIVSIPKAMGWFQRMEDWRDEAMNITMEVFSARSPNQEFNDEERFKLYSASAIPVMRQEYPRREDLQKELDWYEDLNSSLIKLDLEYKTASVAYHCIDPVVRDEMATDGIDIFHNIFEYTRKGEIPIPIEKIRNLDDIIRNARFSARRGRSFDMISLRAGKEEATERLEDLKRFIKWMENCSYLIEQYDSAGRHAMVPGQGVARFNAMGQAQRSRFLLWASQMREVRIAKSRRSIKSVRDIVKLMMGEDERAVLEWPEVIPEPREEVRRSPRAERRRRERLNNAAERELRESHGPGAAFGFR